jgi:hypothetical protein
MRIVCTAIGMTARMTNSGHSVDTASGPISGPNEGLYARSTSGCLIFGAPSTGGPS